jgi:hypothetical protein
LSQVYNPLVSAHILFLVRFFALQTSELGLVNHSLPSASCVMGHDLSRLAFSLVVAVCVSWPVMVAGIPVMAGIVSGVECVRIARPLAPFPFNRVWYDGNKSLYLVFLGRVVFSAS